MSDALEVGLASHLTCPPASTRAETELRRGAALLMPLGVVRDVLRVKGEVVLRSPIMRGPLRLAKGFPLLKALLAAEIAGMAWLHLTKLSRAQRRRVLALLVKSRARPSRLSDDERGELAALAAAFEPRLLAGSIARRLSPVPVPTRVLYGPRGNPARDAAAQRR